MERLASWGWRRFGARYFVGFVAFELLSAYVIAAGTLGLLSLYQPMSPAEWVHIVLLSFVCIALAIGFGIWRARSRTRPLTDWADGARGGEGAPEAWRAAIALPLEIVTRSAWQPVVFVAIPVSAFTTAHLGLPWYSELVVFAGACVAIAYSAVLHFFVSEIALRPVVHDIAL